MKPISSEISYVEEAQPSEYRKLKSADKLVWMLREILEKEVLGEG